MKPSAGLTHFWQALGLFVLVVGGGVEIYTLCTNWQNSLSANIWRALKVRPHEPLGAHPAVWFLTLGAYLTVAAWLAGHFWFEWWRS